MEKNRKSGKISLSNPDFQKYKEVDKLLSKKLE
jgi:hypothetical protein